jgi:type 1 fimbria pilin
MRTFATVALVALLAACGSDSSGPSNRFDGAWIGDALVSPTDTVHFVMSGTQTGSTVAGTGLISEASASEAITFSGTSTSPTMNLTIVAGSSTLGYTATYVRSDSVVGVLSENSASAPLTLRKQ